MNLGRVVGPGGVCGGLKGLVVASISAVWIGWREWSIRPRRSRVDLKHLLGIKLNNPGYQRTILSQFRSGLLTGGPDRSLLEIRK